MINHVHISLDMPGVSKSRSYLAGVANTELQ